MCLVLGEEVEVPLTRPADAGDVDPAEMVEREHDAAAARDPVGAVRAEPGCERTRSPENRPAEEPGDVLGRLHAAERSRTSDSIRSTTSSTSRLVVSISIASGAGCMR